MIDHVVVGINAAFPFSDPVVVALQGVAKDAPHWPHIDPTGNVCLGRLRYSSPAATRILSTLQDALTVLEMTEEEREAEHRREFLSYWAQLGQPTRTPYLSLMGGAKNSRDIAYYKDPRRGSSLPKMRRSSIRGWRASENSRRKSRPLRTSFGWISRSYRINFPRLAGKLLRWPERAHLKRMCAPGVCFLCCLAVRSTATRCMSARKSKASALKMPRRGSGHLSRDRPPSSLRVSMRDPQCVEAFSALTTRGCMDAARMPISRCCAANVSPLWVVVLSAAFWQGRLPKRVLALCF
ncbi:hypothetical protein INP48_01710 [Xanthomonas perforans]|nr:hypothetical protein [Xanthomonas perforans]